ncbi:hypothetical protein IMSAGC012_03690 [Lachnospiraceae bacterium]|nr:hypothetical protein IMSAGC012_03690 [Lachnospiraceae bacterium]
MDVQRQHLDKAVWSRLFVKRMDHKCRLCLYKSNSCFQAFSQSVNSRKRHGLLEAGELKYPLGNYG